MNINLDVVLIISLFAASIFFLSLVGIQIRDVRKEPITWLGVAFVGTPAILFLLAGIRLTSLIP